MAPKNAWEWGAQRLRAGSRLAVGPEREDEERLGTAHSFAFSSPSTGRLKWVLMSSVIEELIRLFGEHLWATVFHKLQLQLQTQGKALRG
ncbi:hypothetical protein NQZ68_008354 [Dissostichus eleginoides]|nr:hypothetical protein NQZ68_008354 [Dissostichus eleginoides]